MHRANNRMKNKKSLISPIKFSKNNLLMLKKK